MKLHAHAAHELVFRQPVELRAHVVGGHVRVTDDPVWPAAFIRHLAHPGDFALEILTWPVCLHVDGLHDTGAGAIAQKLVDQIVAAN